MTKTMTETKRDERGRELGYSVLVLDQTKVRALVHGVLSAMFNVEELAADFKVENTGLLVADTVRKEVRTINTEGVQGEQHFGLNVVDVFVSLGLWIVRIPVGIPALLECTTGEQVELADFIRVFGSRLDSNHALAVKFIKDGPQD